MARTPVQNGETGLVVRGKINEISSDLATAEQTIVNIQTSIMTPAERTKLGYITIAGAEDINQMADNINALSSVDVSDLAFADPLDGAELVPIQQGVNGRKVSTEDIAGDPLTQLISYARNKSRGASIFSRVYPGTNSVNGEYFGQEPYMVHQSGAGAQASCIYFGTLLIQMSTGTTTTGKAALSHCFQTAFGAATRSLDQSMRFTLGSFTPVTQGYSVYFGFVDSETADNPQGMYFRLDPTSNNWFAVVKNGAGTTAVDTGVTATGQTTRMRVFYDKNSPNTKFYINDFDTPVATVANATRVVDESTRMIMHISIRNSSNTTPKQIAAIGYHAYDLDLGITL